MDGDGIGGQTAIFHAVTQFEDRGLPMTELLVEHGADLNVRVAYYIDVRDVDALCAELKPQLDTLPQRDVHGPTNKSYGQRELLVLAPDGNLLAFGQASRRPSVGA
jgi:hypothetical protein